jgi:hypothetical protein
MLRKLTSVGESFADFSAMYVQDRRASFHKQLCAECLEVFKLFHVDGHSELTRTCYAPESCELSFQLEGLKLQAVSWFLVSESEAPPAMTPEHSGCHLYAATARRRRISGRSIF